jgi:hypothetical protein
MTEYYPYRINTEAGKDRVNGEAYTRSPQRFWTALADLGNIDKPKAAGDATRRRA